MTVHEGRTIMTVSKESVGRAALHLARAASLAPSPHNSQPWYFAEEGRDRGFEVHADAGRRLTVADPGGREMVIACGAALFNARIAMRHLGFRPVVDVLPEPGDFDYLARLSFGAHSAPTREEDMMARAMAHRHTHRGPFEHEALPEDLIEELREQATVEGGVLQVIDSAEQLELLAQLVRTAEDVHRNDPWRSAEVSKAIGPFGIPHEACRHHPDRTLLPGRDYLGLAHRYIVPGRKRNEGTGTVAVLSTPYDGRTDWLRAGQALQRVLLYASGHQIRAAFHTQPLELPESRAEVRTRITAGRFPQVVLRLGRANQFCATPRRPMSDLMLPNRVPAGAGRDAG